MNNNRHMQFMSSLLDKMEPVDQSRVSSYKRRSLAAGSINKEFFAIANKFVKGGERENEDAQATEPASARKSVRERLMYIPVSANKGKKRSSESPSSTKKVKLDEERFEDDPAQANERLAKPAVAQKRGRATLGPSEGLAKFRGVFRASKAAAVDSPKQRDEVREPLESVDSAQKDAQGNRLTRHASSNGSDNMATRLAKTGVQFAEVKNKLTETTNLLTIANKRVEELEREVERLVKENRELRKKAETTRQTSQDEGEAFVVKLENVDKNMTSRALLQMAETYGGEVTTARIMKSSTGALHGYCSFALEKDAVKAMEAWRKTGLSVVLVGNAASASVAEPGSSSEKRKSMITGKRWKN